MRWIPGGVVRLPLTNNSATHALQDVPSGLCLPVFGVLDLILKSVAP